MSVNFIHLLLYILINVVIFETHYDKLILFGGIIVDDIKLCNMQAISSNEIYNMLYKLLFNYFV